MKKQELQKILKPLIKECIKEVIFEEGVLSNLIKEVAVGIGSQQTIVETRVEEPTQDFSRQAAQLQEEQRLALEERKRKIEESIGLGSILEEKWRQVICELALSRVATYIQEKNLLKAHFSSSW